MNTVLFQGNMYSVPTWAKWIARDGVESSNEVWIFSKKPRLCAGKTWDITDWGDTTEQLFPVEPNKSFPVECMEITSTLEGE